MLIVCVEQTRVEAELVAGALSCPSCRGVLGPWGHARERVLRCSLVDRLLRPRRGRCRGCAGTHVLLPDLVLLRRQGLSVLERLGERFPRPHALLGCSCCRVSSRPRRPSRSWTRCSS
jgi:hypothetical protein